ncbi:MAG: glycogen(starch) synthase [Parcubacteria bacterium C7867-005]|nr:MAG: glycogen(starch) synthase [Parcubacteria bacterium C7867-005]
MKIVIATPIYPPEIGGPATYTKELCERLHSEHSITVVAYTDVQEAFSGTKLVAVSKNRPLPIRLIKYFIAVWKVSEGADLIYVQNAMAAGLPVALVSIFRKIPFVLKFVGDEAWERATQHKLTEKRLEEFLSSPEGGLKIKLMMMVQGFVLRRAKKVTTPSVYLLEELKKTYGVSEIQAVVNYNAAEDTEVLPFDAHKIPHQIATTARLVAWKGIDGMMRALKIVLRNFPDATLVVAGDGPEMKNLEALRTELGLENSVTLLGKISRAETWQLRKRSEVYVLNSTYEGLPHTVLTSFAAEIPTVATNIPGTNEAVYHEKTGLLVEPGDAEALATAIERYFNNPEFGQKMAKQGLTLLKEKFSWEAHIKNLNDIFKSIVSKPSN